jgi:hypothetical protein
VIAGLLTNITLLERRRSISLDIPHEVPKQVACTFHRLTLMGLPTFHGAKTHVENAGELRLRDTPFSPEMHDRIADSQVPWSQRCPRWPRLSEIYRRGTRSLAARTGGISSQLSQRGARSAE